MSDNNRTATIALIQLSVIPGDKQATVKKAIGMIEKAATEHHAEFVGLPELFNTEFFPANELNNKYFEYAEPIPGPTTEAISKIAKNLGIYVATPIYEIVQPGMYFNSSAIIDPSGSVLGVYRKIHIPFLYVPDEKEGFGTGAGFEKYYYAGGREYPVFNTNIGKIGQVICYDRHYPEGYRILALKGAEIIFVPVASMRAGAGSIFNIETRAMAYMNQVYVAAVNRVGTEGKYSFWGGSHIVGPRGDFIAGPASTDKDEIVVGKVDFDFLLRARSRVALYRDRRPDAYSDILA